MLPGQVRVTRDLLEHRVQLGRSGGDPLEIFVIEHRREFDSGLIAIVQTRPKDTTQNCEDRKRERTDGEHRKEEIKVSTVHAPSKRRRQPESVPSSVIFMRTFGAEQRWQVECAGVTLLRAA